MEKPGLRGTASVNTMEKPGLKGRAFVNAMESPCLRGRASVNAMEFKPHVVVIAISLCYFTCIEECRWRLFYLSLPIMGPKLETNRSWTQILPSIESRLQWVDLIWGQSGSADPDGKI